MTYCVNMLPSTSTYGSWKLAIMVILGCRIFYIEIIWKLQYYTRELVGTFILITSDSACSKIDYIFEFNWLNLRFRYQSSELVHIKNTIWTDFWKESFNTTSVHRCRSVWAFYHFFNRTNDNLIRIRTKMKITRLATRFSNYTQLFQVKLNTVTSTSITVAF